MKNVKYLLSSWFCGTSPNTYTDVSVCVCMCVKSDTGSLELIQVPIFRSLLLKWVGKF